VRSADAPVEYITNDRKEASLAGYFAGFTRDELAGIKAIAMDMWEPYAQAVHAAVPDAASKIVFDKFHIMQYMGEALDKVRRQEHRALLAAGDETLKGSKHLWLWAEERVPEDRREQLFSMARRRLKTSRGWGIKEGLRDFWTCTTRAQAETVWRWWYRWATHSRLEPVIEVAKMLKRHLPNVMTYFDHRITNAAAEGLNSMIQRAKKLAYGYRNRDHFKTAIYFHCGGLDLYPATH
jgi:transposase